MNVQANISNLKDARKAVKAHCMCYRLIETKSEIQVIFPRGFQVDGAQVRFSSIGVSKTKAFELILATMEKYWRAW